jgi:hypothetical protein
MSFVAWIEIYRTYSTEDLVAEIADLRKQSKSNYTGQSAGNKSYTKDPNLVADKLRAAARVMAERGGNGGADFAGVVDFSGRP